VQRRPGPCCRRRRTLSCRRVMIASGSPSASGPAPSSRNLAATAPKANPRVSIGVGWQDLAAFPIPRRRISGCMRGPSPQSRLSFRRRSPRYRSRYASRGTASSPRPSADPETPTNCHAGRFRTFAAERDHEKRIAVRTGLRLCGLDPPPHRSQRAGLPHGGRDRNQARLPHGDHAPTGHVS
jgi:hypothetical protein